MIETKRIYTKSEELNDFILKCAELDYKNNNSYEAMRFDWCLDNGAWFATFKDNEIISISGAHEFRDGYRAMFRGVDLEVRFTGLDKYHMSCWCWYDHLPLVIELADGKPIYTSTNTHTDHSGAMSKMDRVMKLMSKAGLVEHVEHTEVYGVLQNVWKVNVDRYLEVRR